MDIRAIRCTKHNNKSAATITQLVGVPDLYLMLLGNQRTAFYCGYEAQKTLKGGEAFCQLR